MNGVFTNWLFSRRIAKRHQKSPNSKSNEIPLTRWNGVSCTPLTVEEYLEPQLHPNSSYRKVVENTRSFVDLLNPRIDLGNETIGLQDLTSTGKLFEVVSASTEGRSAAALEVVCEKVHHAIARSCPEARTEPWIMQWFVQDDSEYMFRYLTNHLAEYARVFGANSEYSKHWFETLQDHFHDLTCSEGLFSDPTAIDKKWRSKKRRIRLCIWRKSPPQRRANENIIDQICTQLRNSLAHTDVQLIPCGAKDLYEWLSYWFVPCPEKFTGFATTADLLEAQPWKPSDLDRSTAMFSSSAKADISRAALHGTSPWTWKKPGIWWFRGQPSRFITVDELIDEPHIGHLTGERQFGDSMGTLWDQMPEKAIWSMTVVYTPRRKIEEQILKVKRNAVGESAAAAERRKLAETALNQMARGNSVYRVFSGVYVFGQDMQDLDKKTEQVLATLSTHKIRPVVPRYDPIALDSYVRALPFGFEPVQDQRSYARRAKLWFSSHIARMIPVYGRSSGTGYPGCILFNRGAEPILFDPLNSRDRVTNAHSLILGPTGSGKTALIVYLLLHTMAVHRPRILLLTALPTFGLLADHCKKMGLTVHQVQIDGKNKVALPPFKHAQVLLEGKDVQVENNPTYLRDPLGEMEIQARLMITGGQLREEKSLRRDDIDLIRAIIVEAAKLSQTENRTQTMTSDLVRSLYQAAEIGRLEDRKLTNEQRDRAIRMASAINVFCTGFNGELFNREGELWPEVDITVVELNLLTRRGYEDRLAVALTGLFSTINNQIESLQYQDRQTIVVIDEAHILLQNPLVSPYVNRISAMWRSFGAWLWIATQNLRQFPDNAKELLNQPEWWYCLTLEKDEVDQIGRFKSLTQQQKDLLLSARKSPGLYTEGVVISNRMMTLFRNTPPALALALSQTEKNEKAERARIMKEANISELDAAYVIADRLRKNRNDKATS